MKDYTGYSSETLFSKMNKKEFEEYVHLTSEYSYRFCFNKNKNQGLIIDFGGRIGENTRLIDNAVVVEVDKEAIKWMKKNNIRCAENIDSFKDNSVDVIFCSHVLEHVEKPIEIINTFYKKLKSKGKLILVLPAENQIFETCNELFDANGHIYCWNFLTISTLLKHAGFENITYTSIPNVLALYRRLPFTFVFDIIHMVFKIRFIRFLFYLFGIVVFAFLSSIFCYIFGRNQIGSRSSNSLLIVSIKGDKK